MGILNVYVIPADNEMSEMLFKPKHAPFLKAGGKRKLMGLMSAFLLAFMGISADAYGQSYSQAQLTNTLRSIDRNRDFRNLGANMQSANTLAADLQSLEGAFVKAGCQSALNKGQRLNSECRTTARQILVGRRNLAALKEKISSGQALASQRAQIAQRLAGQFGADSTANVQSNTRPRNFFDQLFGGFGGNIVGDEFAGYNNLNTVRSVCVRKSDGYYWPVSFSTLVEYLPNDALLCRPQCPGRDVELYYYSNPGQTPADMINLSGQAYATLPNAFAYRRNFDIANSCRKQIEYGSIAIVAVGGKSRAVININERQVPLPLRDPRRTRKTVVAKAIVVPLPRPRPSIGGQEATGHETKLISSELRIIEVDGKLIRIVGPDTPYAPSVATGT